MNSLQPSDCAYEISTSREGEHSRVFMDITLNVTHPKLGSVASLSAIKIFRRFCKGSFLEVMDGHSHELHHFSVRLFDKFGVVRPWLHEQGTRRGSGCWGRELNNEHLIYVSDITVNEAYRQLGLGSSMLKELVRSKHVEEADTVACCPAPVNANDPIVFFRKNGFRRIGRTKFFGYSPNPAHPSRTTPITADADEQDGNFDPAADQALTREQAASKYPIHLAITATRSPAIADTIKAHHEKAPSSIHTADASGFTPIHIALFTASSSAVRALLELGVADDLRNAENIEGVVPLEGLADMMRSERESIETLVGRWEGYPADALICEFMTKQAMGVPTMLVDPEEYVAKRKWGCTCGTCAGGWLSPRMRFRLDVQAGMEMDAMSGEMSQFEKGVAHEDPTSLIGSACSYLPLDVQQNVYKTFYRGYQTVFSMIHLFLDTTDFPLSTQAIAELCLNRDGVQFFFEKGGKIEHAFDTITDLVRDSSPLGDNSFEEDNVFEEYADLPICDNDSEFGLVRRMMGLDPKLTWGPHYESMTESEVLAEDRFVESVLERLRRFRGGEDT